MSALLVIPALFFAFAGCQKLDSAGRIAVRSGSSVWKTAKPEFGGALLCIAYALVLAAIAGGWL